MTPTPDAALACARRLKVIPFFPRGDQVLVELAAVICERCSDDEHSEQVVSAFIRSRHGLAWPGVPVFSQFCGEYSASTTDTSSPELSCSGPPAPGHFSQLTYYGHVLPTDETDDETIEAIDADAEARIRALKPAARQELEQWAIAQYDAIRKRSQAYRAESEQRAGPSPCPRPLWWSEPYRTALIGQLMRQQMLRHLERKRLRGEPLPPLPERKEKQP